VEHAVPVPAVSQPAGKLISIEDGEMIFESSVSACQIDHQTHRDQLRIQINCINTS
jgi:hypothetical protein